MILQPDILYKSIPQANSYPLFTIYRSLKQQVTIKLFPPPIFWVFDDFWNKTSGRHRFLMGGVMTKWSEVLRKLTQNVDVRVSDVVHMTSQRLQSRIRWDGWTGDRILTSIEDSSYTSMRCVSWLVYCCSVQNSNRELCDSWIAVIQYRADLPIHHHPNEPLIMSVQSTCPIWYYDLTHM